MACCLAMLAAVSAYAKEWPAVKANIPFQFTVGTKVFPAGEYSFTPNVLPGARNQSVRSFKIKGPGNVIGTAEVKTRLAAQIHKTANEVHIAFDKTEGQYILSEIWIPGQDGYLLNISNEEETHEIVTAPM
jgi:hypothetical protein